MQDMVEIYISIRVPWSDKPFGLRYAIDREQAESLYAGKPPPLDSLVAHSEWRRRRERSDALSMAIATSIAHKLVDACDPKWHRECGTVLPSLP